MVADLDLDVVVSGVPTVREPDGLARSSRNVYLSADEHARALALSRALQAGVSVAADGAGAVLAAARTVLDAEPGAAVDYLELRWADLSSIDPVAEPGPIRDHGPARLLVAARVGSTRLIDNIALIL
jgi:pantoate--beta-alanine ligase